MNTNTDNESTGCHLSTEAKSAWADRLAQQAQDRAASRAALDAEFMAHAAIVNAMAAERAMQEQIDSVFC